MMRAQSVITVCVNFCQGPSHLNKVTTSDNSKAMRSETLLAAMVMRLARLRMTSVSRPAQVHASALT